MDISSLLTLFQEVVHSNQSSCTDTRRILSFFKDLNSTYSVFYKELNRTLLNLADSIRSHDKNELAGCLLHLYTNTELICTSVRDLFIGMKNEVIDPIEKILIEFEGINESIIHLNVKVDQQYKASITSIEKHRSLYKHYTSILIRAEKRDKMKENELKAQQEKKLYEDRVRAFREWNTKIHSVLLTSMSDLKEVDTIRRATLQSSLACYKYHYTHLFQSLHISMPELKMKTQDNDTVGIINNILEALNRFEYQNSKHLARNSMPASLLTRSMTDNQDCRQMSHIFNWIFLENCTSPGNIQINMPCFDPVFKLLDTPEGRNMFCLMIENRDQHNRLPIWNLEILGSFINYLLNNLISQQDDSSEIFYKLVTLCQRFYTFSEKDDRTYLVSVISNHSIWKNRIRWENALKWIASIKFHADKSIIPKHRRSKTGFSSLTETLTTLQSSNVQTKQAHINWSVVKEVITEFYKSMINFGLPTYISSEIIQKTCKQLNLLSEDMQNYLMKVPERCGHGIHKRDRIAMKWGKVLPMKYILEYIPADELWQLLCVNKAWRSNLYPYVVHSRIRHMGNNTKNHIRITLWQHILKIDQYSDLNYAEKLHNLEMQDIENAKYFKVIEMDLLRTYQNHPIISIHSIQNVLNVFSIYQPDIGYCQGMNFIAGTLYLVFQNEEKTFYGLVSLLEKYNLKHMYMLNDQMLKLLFYQLDRLVSIMLPEIGDFMKAAEVNSFKFASGWFITLFSMTLKKREDLLLNLWDILLIDGFKTIFKIAVTVLRRIWEILSEKDFDEVMTMLSDKTLSANSFVFCEDFVEEVKKMKVSNSLLKYLEDEYILQPVTIHTDNGI